MSATYRLRLAIILLHRRSTLRRSVVRRLGLLRVCAHAKDISRRRSGYCRIGEVAARGASVPCLHSEPQHPHPRPSSRGRLTHRTWWYELGAVELYIKAKRAAFVVRFAAVEPLRQDEAVLGERKSWSCLASGVPYRRADGVLPVRNPASVPPFAVE